MRSSPYPPGIAFTYDRFGIIYVVLGESKEGIIFLISRRGANPQIATISRPAVALRRRTRVETYLPAPVAKRDQ